MTTTLDEQLEMCFRSEVELAFMITQIYNELSWSDLGFKSWRQLLNRVGITVNQARDWIRTIMTLENAGAEPELLKLLGMQKAMTLLRRCSCLLSSLDRKEQVNAFLFHATSKSLSQIRSTRMVELAQEVSCGKSILPAVPSQYLRYQTAASNHVSEPRGDQYADERHRVLGGLVSQILRGKNRFPEPPENFVVDRDVWNQLTMAVNLERAVLVMGPAGCGKTELVSLLANAMSRPLYRFSFGAMSDARTSLIGTTQYSPEKGSYFLQSRFAQAIQSNNGIILLDEFNRCGPDASNILLPLLDGQRYLSMDESGGTVSVGKSVCFIATANIGVEYGGTSPIDRAIADRFSVAIRLSYPTEPDEIDLLKNRFRGVCPKTIKKVVSVAALQRKMALNGEFESGISTRMLLSTVEQLSYGVPLGTAIDFTLTNHLSADGGSLSDAKRFRQLLQKYI